MKKQGKFIDIVINIVVTKRRQIEKFFMAGVLLCGIMSLFVGTNYDLTEYLPKWAPVEQGIQVMEDHFGYPGSARLMIDDVSIYQAKRYKDQVEALDGVDTVTWLDSTVAVYESEAFLNSHDIEDYYKDGHAVMDILFEEGDSDPETYEAVDQIREMFGEKGHLSGPAIQNKTVEESLGEEMPKILAFGVLAILAILTFTTNSWIEPLLFITTMGIAIVFNMGTNIIFGKISFLSASVSAVLQLAVAMDYSIFLLHTFTREQDEGKDVETAMINALHEAFPSIMASGVTTIIGFLALALMKFTIGMDMGFVMAKGIVWSIITVLFLMPALIIRMNNLIIKTRHKSFVPPLGGVVKILFRMRHIIAAAAVILAVAFIQFFEKELIAGLAWVAVIYLIPSICYSTGFQFETMARIAAWMPRNYLLTGVTAGMSGYECLWSEPEGALKCVIAGVIGIVVFLILGALINRRKEI